MQYKYQTDMTHWHLCELNHIELEDLSRQFRTFSLSLFHTRIDIISLCDAAQRCDHIQRTWHTQICDIPH